jgi:hypothetical protein
MAGSGLTKIERAELRPREVRPEKPKAVVAFGFPGETEKLALKNSPRARAYNNPGLNRPQTGHARVALRGRARAGEKEENKLRKNCKDC